MARNAVTRTVSHGAISSVRADDYAGERRHSSAGLRALLWATSKSFGCSLGSSRESSFPNILTPDSIPQFTIPSLQVQNAFRSQESDGEPSEGSESSGNESSASSSSLKSGLEGSERKAERSVSAPLTQRRGSRLQKEISDPWPGAGAQHRFDPASRAALSLPHLTKVTTPYGFITLGQSPQMAKEEELLCQHRRANLDEAGPSHASEDVKASGSQSRDSETDRTPSSRRQSDSKLKRRFRVAIKKHMPFCH
ncbi:C2 calcium-dependent domain-containing protein 4C-like [Nerophis ophidion]|uniref:C2 calcium-dependent domain-containing protein 4C-like n=1 Tax=Nerophis ophidion TaxID=159077 RepID=UPI002ADF9B55|nr:C2 calcium-dependent domain-containing protein 4C-like [Nerophis ophidion]